MTTGDKLAAAIADYIDTQRAADLPATAALPVRVVADETTRPLPVVIVGIDDSEELLPMRQNYRIGGYVQILAQAKEHTAANVRAWLGCIAGSLSDRSALREALNNAGGTGRAVTSFHLYEIYLGAGETTAEDDYLSGRLEFSAIVAARDV